MFRLFDIVFRSRADLVLENIALRKQIEILKRQNPKPPMAKGDRIFFVWLMKLWTGWKNSMLIVKPETVLGWHRRAFHLYWGFISRSGRKNNTERRREIRRLIVQMDMDNPTWGAPRIHGELLKLGFRVSERTVSRYMPKRGLPGDNHGKWLTFLRNHRHAVQNLIPIALAEWRGRTIYRQRPPGNSGSCHHPQQTASL